VRTIKTASRAIAVRIVWSSRRGSRSIEHIGPAHDETELAALKAGAAERLMAGQAVPGLGVAGPPGAEPFESATKRDSAFRDPVLARIIEPARLVSCLSSCWAAAMAGKLHS
jgi:hypothetical protein